MDIHPLTALTKATNILETALDKKLHRGKEGIPYNAAYLHRGLSQVAERGNKRGKALQHWNEAMKIEAEAGFKKSRRRTFGEGFNALKSKSRALLSPKDVAEQKEWEDTEE